MLLETLLFKMTHVARFFKDKGMNGLLKPEQKSSVNGMGVLTHRSITDWVGLLQLKPAVNIKVHPLVSVLFQRSWGPEAS